MCKWLQEYVHAVKPCDHTWSALHIERERERETDLLPQQILFLPLISLIASAIAASRESFAWSSVMYFEADSATMAARSLVVATFFSSVMTPSSANRISFAVIVMVSPFD